MLGYILCAKTAEGRQLVDFFEQRLRLISQDKKYLDAHLGWVEPAAQQELTQLYNQVYGTTF